VLVVDDEQAILAVVREGLERAGHTVTVASSAARALELFERDPEAFDLILTDLSMPGETGTALIARLRQRRPRVPCLLMTGRGDEGMARDVGALGLHEVLAKPFSIAALLEAVERAAEG
jgi:CheY-like chemotaxis protein